MDLKMTQVHVFSLHCLRAKESIYHEVDVIILRIYRLTEALSYISAHQLLIHLVHVAFEAVQGLCPPHLCMIRGDSLFLFHLLLLLLLLTIFIIIIIIIQII